MTTEVSVAVACACHLGEGARWDARAGVLWWLDVPLPSSLHRLDPVTGRHDQWAMPEMITALAVRENGAGLLVASHSGLNIVEPERGRFEHIVSPDRHKPFNRSNDGAADGRGRFWLGTMQNNMAPDGSPIPLTTHDGTLYRVDPDHSVHAMASGVGISNTVCWSPDQRVMYFADTIAETIFAYDFNAESGAIANRRDFARFDRGFPDGSTVDAEGYLWNCRWGGGCVVRFAPDGRVDRVLDLPVSLVTSCSFGGAALDTLYITTARYGLTPPEEQAGHLFACKPGVTGLPDSRFGG